MKYNLPDRVFRDLLSYAQKHSVEKIILFGLRVRGTNTDRSDIDIAVYGGEFDDFYWDVKEKIHSLLMFDVYNEDEVEEMIVLIRDSFIPAFTVLKETLEKKLKETESDWS